MDSSEYLQSLFGCKGRTAVVTGASSGLGREMARVLVQVGADVLAVARRSELLESFFSELVGCAGSVLTCRADLSQHAGIDKVAQAAENRLGGCDILVASAGIADRIRLEKMVEEEFTEVVHLNVTSQWLLSKTLFRFISKSESGRIINIASVYGLGASVYDGLGAYAVSKHVLVGLARTQAVEWSRFGITSNAIAPSFFDTEMTNSALADDKLSSIITSFSPQYRFGNPPELATALLFLASAESSYVNGAIVLVDGD